MVIGSSKKLNGPFNRIKGLSIRKEMVLLTLKMIAITTEKRLIFV